ncbi:MAE_28990/MAE_18760 family HEPN-like nuclease [Glaesserella parasuis]|nr:MAE_28990/MAE_18760 family HEPN-like nuclease [Glaesserella parasuis]
MSLEALKEDLRQRDADIEKLYLHLIQQNENDELSHILKANLFVMLYNKVEFFFREFIFSIYDEIHDQNLSFFQLKPHIQQIIADYLFPKDSTKQKKYDLLKRLFENNITYYKPERVDIANGNIDGELIKEVLKQYEINPSQVYCEGDIKLHTLKIIRNKLAHGEESFSATGKQYSVNQVKKLKEDIERIFLALQDELEIFLNDKHYLMMD